MISQSYTIDISPFAIEQILIIRENDYTIEASTFRLAIDGKGCTGFTYALGFSSPEKDDIKLGIQLDSEELVLLLDPFAAFYCKSGLIDYKRNSETGEEGFIFINHNEKMHQGKFFKDESKTPEHL